MELEVVLYPIATTHRKETPVDPLAIAGWVYDGFVLIWNGLQLAGQALQYFHL